MKSEEEIFYKLLKLLEFKFAPNQISLNTYTLIFNDKGYTFRWNDVTNGTVFQITNYASIPSTNIPMLLTLTESIECINNIFKKEIRQRKINKLLS